MSRNADVRIVNGTVREKIFFGDKYPSNKDETPKPSDLFESAAKWLREMPYEDDNFIDGLHWEEREEHIILSIYYEGEY